MAYPKSMPRFGRPAGDYNVPGTIQQNVPIDPCAAESAPNWVDYETDVWFAVVGKSGRDTRKFEQLHPTVSYLVYCRYDEKSAAIAPARFRILLDDGQVLNIQACFDVNKRHVEMEFQCTEIKL